MFRSNTGRDSKEKLRLLDTTALVVAKTMLDFLKNLYLLRFARFLCKSRVKKSFYQPNLILDETSPILAKTGHYEV